MLEWIEEILSKNVSSQAEAERAMKEISASTELIVPVCYKGTKDVTIINLCEVVYVEIIKKKAFYTVNKSVFESIYDLNPQQMKELEGKMFSNGFILAFKNMYANFNKVNGYDSYMSRLYFDNDFSDEEISLRVSVTCVEICKKELGEKLDRYIDDGAVLNLGIRKKALY